MSSCRRSIHLFVACAKASLLAAQSWLRLFKELMSGADDHPSLCISSEMLTVLIRVDGNGNSSLFDISRVQNTVNA